MISLRTMLARRRLPKRVYSSRNVSAGYFSQEMG